MAKLHTLTYTGTLTIEESIYTHVILRRLTNSFSKRLLIVAFSSVVFIMCFVAFYLFGFNLGVANVAMVSGALLYWYGIHMQFHPWFTARRNAKNLKEHTADISLERIALSNNTAGVWIEWKLLHKLITTPRGVMFMSSPKTIWFFLPERTFGMSSSKEDLLAMAMENNVPIVEVS